MAVPELYVIFWDSTSTVLRLLSRAPWRIPGAREQKTDTRGQRLSSLSCTSMVLTASMTSEAEGRAEVQNVSEGGWSETFLTFRRSGRGELRAGEPVRGQRHSGFVHISEAARITFVSLLILLGTVFANGRQCVTAAILKSHGPGMSDGGEEKGEKGHTADVSPIYSEV